jgi:uncharacterized repeat protein (TIGR03803 family)
MSIARLFAAATLVAGAGLAPPAVEAASFTTLYNFSGTGDGGWPFGPLTYHHGFLYGTGFAGGTNTCAYGCGVVFKVDASSGAETVLYNFPTKKGTPFEGVIYERGKLFGVTSAGGATGHGTVFELNPVTGQERAIYTFTGGTDGNLPYGRLTYANGNFYGVAGEGGATNNGTVFALNATTHVETVLYNFAGGTDGAQPRLGMIFENGTLYGTTTRGGGQYGGGVAFAVNATTGAETVLHAFSGTSDGYGPSGILAYASGILYGVTHNGGINGDAGTVFSIDTATNAEQILYTFLKKHKGTYPDAGVTLRGSVLYGSTEFGGASNDGVLFRLNPATGSKTVLHSFSGTDGSDPSGELVYVGGSFYGVTGTGGPLGYGTVFRLTP